LPASAPSRAADAVCRRFADAALTNHSVRSYLWAARYAADNGLRYDADVLYVAAMVHDLGLTATFDAYRTPFEMVGGELGWVLGVGAGWSSERAQRVTDIAT
ncbi:MAG: HD domain-containing protein, partial [Jiangellaceae bacterium]